jgi:hypothetical protein
MVSKTLGPAKNRNATPRTCSLYPDFATLGLSKLQGTLFMSQLQVISLNLTMPICNYSLRAA